MTDASDDPIVALLRARYSGRASPIRWESVDPDWLVEIASAHDILRAVYQAVSADPAAPPGLVSRLRQACLLDHGRASELALEAARLHALLAARGIASLLVKGPALAVQLYGQSTARSSCDIDLLVRPGEFGDARRLLDEAGYQMATASPPDPSDKHLILRGARNQILVELHWTLSPPAQEVVFDEEELWERSVSIPVAGQPVATLSLPDAVLHLAAHGRTHRWSHWKWVCDVAQSLTLPLDWAAVLELAVRRGWRRTLLVACEVAHRMLQVEPPAILAAACRSDPAVPALAAAILRTPDADDFRRDPNNVLLEEFRYRDTIRARFVLAASRVAGAVRPKNGEPRGGVPRPLALYRRYGLGWLREIF